MKCNVGKIDRVVRIVLGIGVLGAGAYFGNWLGAIGIIPLLTGALGFCPLYLPFRVSTCEGRS